MDFLDIIVLFLYMFKNSSSETGLCLRSQSIILLIYRHHRVLDIKAYEFIVLGILKRMGRKEMGLHCVWWLALVAWLHSCAVFFSLFRDSPPLRYCFCTGPIKLSSLLGSHIVQHELCVVLVIFVYKQILIFVYFEIPHCPLFLMVLVYYVDCFSCFINIKFCRCWVHG